MDLLVKSVRLTKMRIKLLPFLNGSRSNSGFTLIELVIVIGIVTLLFGFMAISLVNNKQITSINSVRDTLISDMASQQTKAMNGSGGAVGTSYGIYFLSNKYVLFKGDSYNPQDTSNFEVEMDSNIAFANVGFASSAVLFASGSGEVVGFQNGQNTVGIQDTNGNKTETITINKYGVVTND